MEALKGKDYGKTRMRCGRACCERKLFVFGAKIVWWLRGAASRGACREPRQQESLSMGVRRQGLGGSSLYGWGPWVARRPWVRWVWTVCCTGWQLQDAVIRLSATAHPSLGGQVRHTML
jgi:hypothetical protein